MAFSMESNAKLQSKNIATSITDVYIGKANSLLSKCDLADKTISALTDCSPSMFIVIYENIARVRIPNIERKPQATSEHLKNLQTLLDFLCKRYHGALYSDLPTLSAAKIYTEKHTPSICKLLDIMVAICDEELKKGYSTSSSTISEPNSHSSASASSSARNSTREVSTASILSHDGYYPSDYSVTQKGDSSTSKDRAQKFSITSPRSEMDRISSFVESQQATSESVQKRPSSSSSSSKVSSASSAYKSSTSEPSSSSASSNSSSPRELSVFSFSTPIDARRRPQSDPIPKHITTKVELPPRSESLPLSLEKQRATEKESLKLNDSLEEKLKRFLNKKQISPNSSNDQAHAEEDRQSFINQSTSSSKTLSESLPSRKYLQQMEDRQTDAIYRSQTPRHVVINYEPTESPEEPVLDEEQCTTPRHKKKRKRITSPQACQTTPTKSKPNQKKVKQSPRQVKRATSVEKRIPDEFSKYGDQYSLYLKDFLKNMREDEIAAHTFSAFASNNIKRNMKIEELKFNRFQEEQERLYQSTLLARRSQEEQMLRKAYKKMVHVEKEKIMYEKAKHEQFNQQLEERYRNKISSIDNYFTSQIDMVKDKLEKQRAERELSEKAQKLAIERLYRDLKEKRWEQLNLLRLKSLSHDERRYVNSFNYDRVMEKLFH